MELLLQFVPGFLLVFCRITSFFVVVPVFSARNVPMPFKIGFAFFVAVLTLGALNPAALPLTFDNAYPLQVIKEILVGLLLGFVAYMFFIVVQVAGAFIDMQIGFSMANVIDPMTGAQSPVIGNLKFMLATLLFLTANGHHYFIRGVMDSYRWIPVAGDPFGPIASGQVSQFLLTTFTVSFSAAFQMAGPLVAAMFLVDVGLGILAKTAPQYNIFVIGMPLKLIVGLMLLFAVMPSMAGLFNGLFSSMFDSMQKLVELLSGRSGG